MRLARASQRRRASLSGHGVRHVPTGLELTTDRLTDAPVAWPAGWMPRLLGVIAVFVACSDPSPPTPAPVGSKVSPSAPVVAPVAPVPPATPAPSATPAIPAAPTTPTTTAPPTTPTTPAPPAAPGGPLPDLGAPQEALLPDAERPLRSAIREQIQARPTVVAGRHYLGADGSTTSFVVYTYSHVERCMTKGGSREECRMGAGFGTTAFNSLRCLGAGVARVQTRPGRAVAALQAHLPLHSDNLCSASVRELAVEDLDRDGRPELALELEWADLRLLEVGEHTSWSFVERLVLRADLGAQVALRLRAIFHPENADFGDRSRVARLQTTDPDGDGVPDFELAVTSWRSGACPREEPPPPTQEGCELRQRTERYTYRGATDDWRAQGPVDPRSPTEHPPLSSPPQGG